MTGSDRLTIAWRNPTTLAGGITAIAMGCFMAWRAWLGAGLLPGGAAMPAAALPLSAVLAIVGVVLASIREGRTIDRRTRTVSVWWRASITLQRETFALSRYDVVRVALRRVGTEWHGGARLRFTVTLRGAGTPLLLGAFTTHTQARAQAERVAEFIDFPVRDMWPTQAQIADAIRAAQTVQSQNTLTEAGELQPA